MEEQVLEPELVEKKPLGRFGIFSRAVVGILALGFMTSQGLFAPLVGVILMGFVLVIAWALLSVVKRKEKHEKHKLKLKEIKIVLFLLVVVFAIGLLV